MISYWVFYLLCLSAKITLTFIRLSPVTLPPKTNENGFARAFGGDGGTCECRGGRPPGPPPTVTSRAHSPFLCFLQEKIFGE